jgi:hypothetical protein
MVASALAILLPIAAHAQTGSDSKSRLMFDPSGLQGSKGGVAKPLTPRSPTTGQSTTPRQTQTPTVTQTVTPRPAPAARQAATPKPPARAASPAPARPAATRPAQANNTVERAPAGAASERPIPREQPTALGRLDLPGGSVGYESRTAMQPYDLGDGRRVPGTDNIQRNDSSYFGLSLRMPTATSGSSIFGRHGAD